MSNPHIAPALECLDPEGDFCWENSDLANIGERLEAQAQATLALAYEARTANLIAFFATQPLSKYHTLSTTARRDYIRLHSTLETRLGLGDTK